MKRLQYVFLQLGFYLVLCLVSNSCEEQQQPKPFGELRLEYPRASYLSFSSSCPFVFDYSKYANIHESKLSSWWYNLSYNDMKANVFITYLPVQNNLSLHIKEAEKMVYNHTIKASSIETKSFSYPEKKVFGNFYELQGETASNIQFYITDSTKHFVTGSLVFKTRPRPDSLAPAIGYVKQDLIHLIDTFHWK